MGSTPNTRRSGRERRPTPRDPMNSAEPPIPNRPSVFKSQRRSESAKKGWQTRRDHKNNPDNEIPLNPFPSDTLLVSSTLFTIYGISDTQTLMLLCLGKGFK